MYQEHLATVTDADPRHVEAWLRLEYGTLDHLPLDRQQVAPFATLAREHPTESEALAESFGLRKETA